MDMTGIVRAPRSVGTRLPCATSLPQPCSRANSLCYPSFLSVPIRLLYGDLIICTGIKAE